MTNKHVIQSHTILQTSYTEQSDDKIIGEWDVDGGVEFVVMRDNAYYIVNKDNIFVQGGSDPADVIRAMSMRIYSLGRKLTKLQRER